MRTLGRGAAPLLLAAVALLAGAAVLVGGGSSDDRLVWIGGGAIVLAGLAVAALGRPQLDARGWVFLALLAAFVAWNGFSVLWSIEGDRSWNYFNRGLAYLAFAVLGVYLGAHVREAARVVAAGLALLIAVAVSWALMGKIVPAIAPDNARIARLHLPLQYWNALALLIAMGLPIGLWLAARPAHRAALRTAAVAFLYLSTVALLLTYSRGGILVAGIAVGVWLVLGRPRLESAAACICAGVPGLGVALWAFGRAGIAKDQQRYSVRVHDGALFGLALVLVGVLVTASAYVLVRAERRWPLSAVRRRLLGRAAGVLALVGAMAAIGVAAATVHPGRVLHDFGRQASPNVVGTPERLTTVSSSSRWDWWKEAWQGFKSDPWKGTGAGSFGLVHTILRKNALSVTEPHNVPLQALSETGVVGFALFVGASVVAIVGVVSAVRRSAERERIAAIVLAIAALAYLLHAIGDFDWDFLAVTAPLFVVVGVLLGAGRAVGPRPRPFATVSVAVVVLAVVYSFGAAWLSRRDVRSAYAALAAGHVRAAHRDARRAHSLDPLSLEALLARAAAETAARRFDDARHAYVQAIELQPLNWLPWYELATFEASRGRLRVALRYAERSVALNPWAGQVGPFVLQLQRQIGGG
jgi:hypothetical protein